MSEVFFPIIEARDLVNKIQNDDLVLIDARSGADAHKKYLEEHLKGAHFVDLEKQLADIKPDVANGGRHPLPDPKKFARIIGELGVDADSHVVVYDDKNGANAAARFWWMLRSLGHAKIQVLNGGYAAATRQGFPTGSGEEKVMKKEMYKGDRWLFPIATMSEVEMAANDYSYRVIDVREKMRYDGEHEPIDLIAGHIPGAINLPYTNNLDENGLFLSSEELKGSYTKISGGLNPENIIVHCGSGVTACHTILAMAAAGFNIPVLYTGSWSEWSRNDRPVATASSK